MAIFKFFRWKNYDKNQKSAWIFQKQSYIFQKKIMEKYILKDYSTKEIPSWCPGCGDFTILNSLKLSFTELQIAPENICLIAGIWCWSLMPYWINTYWMCTLHWRAIPVAKWVKIANKDLTVVVNCWDWDGLWIWLGHFSHSFRRNLDMTILIDNNWTYWLTKWQTAPTSKKNTFSSSTPFWSIEEPVNWLAIALTMWATFVARAFAGDQKSLTKIMTEAIKHKWTAIIEILQPCPTFNKVETYEFYYSKVEHWENEVWNVIKSKEEAYEIITKLQDKIPLWIFYVEEKSTYEENCFQMEKESLVNQNIENISMKKAMSRFL